MNKILLNLYLQWRPGQGTIGFAAVCRGLSSRIFCHCHRLSTLILQVCYRWWLSGPFLHSFLCTWWNFGSVTEVLYLSESSLHTSCLVIPYGRCVYRCQWFFEEGINAISFVLWCSSWAFRSAQKIQKTLCLLSPLI